MLSWNIFKDIIILSNFVYKRKHINICHCITEVWAKLLSFYTLKYFIGCMRTLLTKRVWRHQRGNQNPFIKEELTTQWPKENVQKDKQRLLIVIYSIYCLILQHVLCTFKNLCFASHVWDNIKLRYFNDNR
jgi:hypothetical protein